MRAPLRAKRRQSDALPPSALFAAVAASRQEVVQGAVAYASGLYRRAARAHGAASASECGATQEALRYAARRRRRAMRRARKLWLSMRFFAARSRQHELRARWQGGSEAREVARRYRHNI